MRDTVIRSRVEPQVKLEASAILEEMGLSMSDAIRIFLNQVIVRKALPFSLRTTKTPNAKTLEALEAIEQGKGLEEVTLQQLAKEAASARKRVASSKPEKKSSPKGAQGRERYRSAGKI